MISYKVTIARFELYPREEPTCYCVGFSGSTLAGRSFYQDTQVPLEEAAGITEEEIVALAWGKLKDNFILRMEDIASKPIVLGQIWDHQIEKLSKEAKEVIEGQ